MLCLHDTQSKQEILGNLEKPLLWLKPSSLSYNAVLITISMPQIPELSINKRLDICDEVSIHDPQTIRSRHTR